MLFSVVFYCFVRRLLEEIEPVIHLLVEQEKEELELFGLVLTVLICLLDSRRLAALMQSSGGGER